MGMGMTTQWELKKDKRDKDRIVKNTVSKGTVGRKEQKEIKNEREALTGDRWDRGTKEVATASKVVQW